MRKRDIYARHLSGGIREAGKNLAECNLGTQTTMVPGRPREHQKYGNTHTPKV